MEIVALILQYSQFQVKIVKKNFLLELNVQNFKILYNFIILNYNT